MISENFKEIFQLIKDDITKGNTKMRDPIPLLRNFVATISFLSTDESYKSYKAVGTGRTRGPLAPSRIFFSKVKMPFFNNHVNTFYFVWHKVKSFFRSIPSKIMIKFACSVMGKPFLAILGGLKLKFSTGALAPTIVGPPTSIT